MSSLTTLFGTGAGLVLGYLAWVISRRFKVHYIATENVPLYDNDKVGSIPMWIITVLAMAVWGAWVALRSQDFETVIAVMTVTTLLLIIVIVDYSVRRIPNVLILALLVWAVVQIVWMSKPAPQSALIGFLVGGGLFFLIALVGRGVLGMGDVKLVAAEGAFLGFPLVLHGMFWGIMLGGLAALFLLVTKRAGRKDSFAYGPYLALGAWIIYLAALNMLPWQG